MGVVIQAESHRVELAGLYEYEHDDRTLEFYDQPPAIKLGYEAKRGRQLGVWHTPDYFVLRTDGVGWEEWKTEAGLERLSETMPHRYIRDADGRWRCPPGEHFAEAFGLLYRLRSDAEIDWVLQRNLRFLADYLAVEPPPVSKHAISEILALVRDEPGLRLDEVVGQLDEARADDVYTLIASNTVYVDLQAAPLAEPERVRLFRDSDVAHACALVGMTEPAAQNLSTAVHEQLARASPADLREANRRHAIISPYLAGMSVVPGTTPDRTIRDWVTKWRAAEQIRGSGYVGLLPRLYQSGNRQRKLPKPPWPS